MRAPRCSSQPGSDLKVRAERFAESAWKLLVYGSLSAYGLRLLAAEGWAARSEAWWKGWPDQPVSPALRWYYSSELGLYVSSVWMLAAWETRRKDHRIMMTHHLATITLIALSYVLGWGGGEGPHWAAVGGGMELGFCPSSALATSPSQMLVMWTQDVGRRMLHDHPDRRHDPCQREPPSASFLTGT